MITLLVLFIISIVLLALTFFIGAIAMVTCGALYFAQGSFDGLTDAGAICLIVFGSLILLPSIPLTFGNININTN